MAESTQDQEFMISETLGKSEHFITQNKKSLGIIFGALLLAAIGYWFYQMVYVAGKEKEAQQYLFRAEQYLNADSLKLAINGDGNNLGLEDIADQYGMSPSGNLAKYYLGMAYLKMKDYDRAIETLRSYDAKDEVTGAIVYGALGDAYSEKKEFDEAISYYEKATKEEQNNFVTPIMMMKLAIAYELKGNYKDAKDIYSQLKVKFPTSSEAAQADKYISRAENLMAK